MSVPSIAHIVTKTLVTIHRRISCNLGSNRSDRRNFYTVVGRQNFTPYFEGSAVFMFGFMEETNANKILENRIEKYRCASLNDRDTF